MSSFVCVTLSTQGTFLHGSQEGSFPEEAEGSDKYVSMGLSTNFGNQGSAQEYTSGLKRCSLWPPNSQDNHADRHGDRWSPHMAIVWGYVCYSRLHDKMKESAEHTFSGYLWGMGRICLMTNIDFDHLQDTFLKRVEESKIRKCCTILSFGKNSISTWYHNHVDYTHVMSSLLWSTPPYSLQIFKLYWDGIFSLNNYHSY